MRELFPYHGEKILVTPEMCDHNGHMNTGSYTRCFDGCWGQMYTDMGFDDDYFNNHNQKIIPYTIRTRNLVIVKTCSSSSQVLKYERNV